jgi:hypothetical protein
MSQESTRATVESRLSTRVLSRHYDIENGAYDVLGNHKNRHRFLRNHGYIH